MPQAAIATITGRPSGTPDIAGFNIVSVRAFLAARIERDIAALDRLDGDADIECNGDEFEDVEGDYSIPGRLYLSGATDDDEDDDVDEDEDGLS